MVPYYEEFEQAFAVTGTNENPFIPMYSNFPLPPHPPTPVGTMFQTATEALGYSPFPQPSGLASQPYVNQYGVQINACVYDGWCSRRRVRVPMRDGREGELGISGPSPPP